MAVQISNAGFARGSHWCSSARRCIAICALEIARAGVWWSAPHRTDRNQSCHLTEMAAARLAPRGAAKPTPRAYRLLVPFFVLRRQLPFLVDHQRLSKYCNAPAACTLRARGAAAQLARLPGKPGSFNADASIDHQRSQHRLL